MEVFDIFKQDAFSMQSLTTYMNNVDYVPGQVSSLGLFTENRVNTTVVGIEERNGVLQLLSTKERGQSGDLATKDKRNYRAIKVPHIPHPSRIMADEIQGVREFGTPNQLQTMQSVVNRRLQQMASNHDATLEHLMVGAVKGTILDADGVTVLYNLFNEFGVSQYAEIDFDLDNATPAAGALRKKCHEVFRKIQDELKNRTMSHVHALCSPEFFDDLVSHPEATVAYERQEQGKMLRTGLARKRFEIFDIVFEEYRGTVNGTSFIAANKAHFFPAGSPGVFEVHYAPANYVETVNTAGLPRYARLAVDPQFNKYVEVETQSNPLPLCNIPRALILAKRT